MFGRGPGAGLDFGLDNANSDCWCVERCQALTPRSLREDRPASSNGSSKWAGRGRPASATEKTLVSYHGGLWISRADTEARPGSGSPAWRLTVKSR